VAASRPALLQLRQLGQWVPPISGVVLLASGGLTLGGGLLAGGVIGALGAGGLARLVNVVRGTDQSWLPLAL
jgi:hypothetical protein